MSLFIFQKLDQLGYRLDQLEKKLDQYIDQNKGDVKILRDQLTQIKNGLPLRDSWIQNGYFYYDLSPHDAYELYNSTDKLYTVLNVSQDENAAGIEFDNIVHIPLKVLDAQIELAKNLAGPHLTGPLLVISNRGLESILACEILAKHRISNIYNVSGGFEFWPTNKDVAA